MEGLEILLTFAIGGMANLKDRGGVICENSSCSRSENPSFRNAGRLYWATSEFIVQGVRAGRSEVASETEWIVLDSGQIECDS